MLEYTLCGSCIYYDSKDRCIKGVCGATVSLFKNGTLIASLITDKCGNYVFKVNELGTYLITVNRCGKCIIVCVVLCSDPKNVYIKNIVFN